MIEEGVQLRSGMVVRHDQGGLLYRVDGTSLCTNDYEATHQIGEVMVRYTQLQQGELYGPGQEYVKDEDKFRPNFTIVTDSVESA